MTDHLFNNSKYAKWYFNIIKTALTKPRKKARNVISEYFEKHHIIPKSIGGDNNNSNLVLLTAKEHFICHLLLTKMCIDKTHHRKIIFAWRSLAVMTGRNSKNKSTPERDLITSRKITSKLFEKLREGHAQLMSERGKRTLTPERVQAMIVARGDKTGTNNPAYGVERSEQSKRQYDETIAVRRASGWKSSQLGAVRDEETRLKMSESAKKRASDPLERLKRMKENSHGDCITPWGTFSSAEEASRAPNALFTTPRTVRRKCLLGVEGFYISFNEKGLKKPSA